MMMLLDCEISLHDKIACLKRELGYRERVYPKLVRTGAMKAEAAYREMAVMEAILKDYSNAREPD